MKTTVLSNKYRPLNNSSIQKQFSYSTGVCVCAKYSVLGTPAYLLYFVRSYVESNSVLVADGDTTSEFCCVANKERGP